jgi:hypothetical protein
MPSVTFDGRSFMLDGRRVWIVSGSIHYARVPRELWADRIHAAKLAGLNTVETPVFWNRHEPRPGQFDFTGNNDIRHFIELIGKAGLHCILRPGPFVDSDWELGGLPSWLLDIPGAELRSGSGPFLEAVSRYFTALAAQVRDLQVTSPGRGGPILLVQNEHAWTCGHDLKARAYLGELSRYLRESGFTVPAINANNLWQGIESEIDCWSGAEHMLAIMRQLALVRPDQPRLVIDMHVAPARTRGQEPPPAPTPAGLQRRLAEVLAGGGQFNIQPFHGGTNFEHWAGRSPLGHDLFVTTSADRGEPLSETGAPGQAYHHVRRLCTFASRFSRLLANLDPAYRPVVLDPATPPAARGKGPAVSVVHAQGSQGGIAFVFGPPPSAGSRSGDQPIRLLLPEGTPLTLHMGDQSVAWCLFGVSLSGRAILDYSTLNALGVVGKALVVYGPAGLDGQVSINGTPITVTVPKGRTPLTLEHEGLTLVVCNEQQADAAYMTDSEVLVGVASISADGEPTPLSPTARYTRIGSDGIVSTRKPSGTARSRAPVKVQTSEWRVASLEEYVDGSSPRYAAIDGAADLAVLGAPMGYGWYRISLKSGATRRPRAAAPQGADRLLLFHNSEPAGVLGYGPGAVWDAPLSLVKGAHNLVVLADNMGRVSGGVDLDRRVGLYGDLWEVKPLRVGRAQIEPGEPIDLLAWRTPLWEVHQGESTSSDRLTWNILHRRRTPVFMDVRAVTGANRGDGRLGTARALILLNGEPVQFLDSASRGPVCFWPDEGPQAPTNGKWGPPLRAGRNVIQLALLPDATDAEGNPISPKDAAGPLATGINFFEGVNNLTEKAQWAFAKWEPPQPAACRPAGENPASPGSPGTPAWWRCSFTLPEADAPLLVDLTGLTKGQLYINDRHVGRYFVATPDGKAVPPQNLYYIPEPWTRRGDGPNELLIFDESGAAPGKVRLILDTDQRPVRA